MASLYPLVAARHGRFFVNNNDTYVGRSLRLYGEWSEIEIELFSKFVMPGDAVIEAGANIGSHTIWLSKQVGEAGSVLAFEPARHTFQLLCANLVANECLNVRAVQQAVGDTVSTVAFPLLDPRGSWNFGGASIKNPWSEISEPVVCVTLDSLDLARVDFIKADVEEFEPELLRGARQMIEKHRPAVYLEINKEQVRNMAVDYFESLNYACWYYITPMFSGSNFLGNPEDVFKYFSFDMLCMPQEKFLVEGMARAGVDDKVVTYTQDQIAWLIPDARQARITRL